MRFVALALLLLAGCGGGIDHGKCTSKNYFPAHDEPRTGRRWHSTGTTFGPELGWDGEIHWTFHDTGYYEDYTYYEHIPDRWTVNIFRPSKDDEPAQGRELSVSFKDYERAVEGEYFYLHPPESE